MVVIGANQTCYAIVNNVGWLLQWTTSLDQSGAIERVVDPKKPGRENWRDMVSSGWRVIPVRVTPATTDA